MSVTVSGFPLGWMEAWKAGVDLDGATWKLSLHTASMTPNLNTWNFQDDLTNALSAANGYSVATLSGVAFSYDAGSGQVRVTFTGPSWTFTADQTWRYAVAWVDTAGAASADPVLLLLDWGSSQTVQGAYSIPAPTDGFFAFDFTP